MTGGAVLGPLVLVALSLAPEGRWQALDHAGGLLLAAGLLGSGLLLWVHWLVTRWPGTAWLVVTTTGVGSYLAFTEAHGLAYRSTAGAQDLERIVFGVLALTLTLLAPRAATAWGGHPGAAGLALGGVAALVVVVAPDGPLALAPASAPGLLLAAGILACGALLAWTALTRVGAPEWVRRRMALAMLLAASAQAVSSEVALWATVAVVVVEVLAAILLLESSRLVVSSTVEDLRRALDNLRGGLERQESAARSERATLHEIRATLSGIAQAVPMTGSSEIPAARREELRDMVSSELSRLERMVEPGRERERAVVDLDRTLERIVLRQRIRGQRVLWQPSGHGALVQEDSLAEIVSILLENARRHAPGATSVVEVVPDGDQLHIVLSDNGRGVPTRWRPDIFEWGVHSPESRGQGIGLAVARDLARENSGDLELADTGVGATFVLTLPALVSEPRLSADQGDWHDARTA